MKITKAFPTPGNADVISTWSCSTREKPEATPPKPSLVQKANGDHPFIAPAIHGMLNFEETKQSKLPDNGLGGDYP